MYAKLKIAYDGASFYGFQKQVDSVYTVAGTIEYALNKLFKQKTTVIGAGRTDKGVHATGQVVGFKMPFFIGVNALKKALTSLLPESISILSISYQDQRFHAIQDAVAREYHYCITTHKEIPVYLKPYVVSLPGTNIDDLMECLSLFYGDHNFAAFCSNRKDMFDTHCSIYDVSVKSTFQNTLPFAEMKTHIYSVCFLGRSFLYKMIRHLLGAGFACLQGHLSLCDLRIMLKTGHRHKNWSLAPARGLFLTDVHYKS